MDTEVFILREIINWLDPTKRDVVVNSKISLIKLAKEVVIRAMQSNPCDKKIRKAASEVYRIEHESYNQIDYDAKANGLVSATTTVR